MNKGIFIGNLGRDAELRTLEGGTVAISFNLAIDESYKNKQGEKINKTTWLNCTKWVRNGGSTNISKWLVKGAKVCVEGTMSARAWQNKEGEPMASLECNVINLELLGGAKPADGTAQTSSTQQQAATNDDPFNKFTQDNGSGSSDIPIEDDLPF